MMNGQGGLLGGQMQGGDPMPEDPAMGEGAAMEEDPEQDPGYVSATDYVRDKLINSGGAEAIAEMVRAGPEDAMNSIAELAYEVIDAADAKAKPPMQEENLIPLALFVLEEFWDVAAAAMNQDPSEIDPAQIFGSLKIIIKRFVSELGPGDPAADELMAAMDAITPDQIRQMMAESGGEAPAEQMPMQGGAPMPPQEEMPQ